MTSALGPASQQYLDAARQLQALSFAVHIPLVCFGIAFPPLVLFTEWRWRRTGDPALGALARRWSKVMIALFAVGVVTGTVLSFEMGLLWPGFTGTYGGVFGLAFSLEGFSFFLEAIFLGIYVYGWDRLSPRAHMLSGIPVALAGLSGSLFVISVNGWMQNPSGFKLVNGRPVDIHPWSALFGNDFFWHELVHMYIAAYLVTGCVVGMVYAVAWLRGRRDRYVRNALAVAVIGAAVAAPVQIVIGDWAAREVAAKQPIKLAALEGLGKTTKGASEHLGGWYENGEVKYGIAIPHLLSVLAFHSWDAKVQGLESVPPQDRPDEINVVRIAFQFMVGIGTALAAGGVGLLLFLWRRKRMPDGKWFHRVVVLAGPASLVALISGWVVTEVGRQPWVVYHVMRTADAVTGHGGIPIAYGTLVLVYVALFAGVVWGLRRLARTRVGEEAAAHAG